MTIREWMDAMTLDQMIAIYLGLVVLLVLAIVWQLVDAGIYAYRMRRAKRHSRKVIGRGEFTQRMRQAR